MPLRWLSSILTVMRLALGQLGSQFEMGSSRLRRPSSCSFRKSAATKVLVSDAMAKGVLEKTGRSALATRLPATPTQRLPSGSRTAAATPGAPCDAEPAVQARLELGGQLRVDRRPCLGLGHGAAWQRA